MSKQAWMVDFFDIEAPTGQVYVCGSCGRSGKTMKNWDTSCVYWAVRCYEDKPDNQWVAVTGASAIHELEDGSSAD